MKKTTIYLIVGVSGSGKSWVADKLEHYIKYVPYDRTPKDEVLKIMDKATVPILYDPTVGISTFITRNKDRFDIIPFFIIGDFLTVKQQLKDRGGVITKSLYKRWNRIKKISTKHSVFTGSSTDVFKHLKEILSSQRPYKIYKATSPSGKVYIGKSSLNLSIRISTHKHDALIRNKTWAISSAIRKYGDTIKWEIIHDNIHSYPEINYLEKKYIAHYRSNDPECGYNLTEGGDGGQLLGESWIKKSVSLKKFYASDKGISMKEHLKKVSTSMREKNGEGLTNKIRKVRQTSESRAKTSTVSTKFYSSQEERNKQAVRLKDLYNGNYELRKKVAMATRASRARSFEVIAPDGILVGLWDSATTCGEDLNLSRGGISACLNGHRGSVKGYRFKWIDSETNI